MVDLEYRPFPDLDGRNWRQEAIEIPAMARLLGIGRGLRLLEVGCGRGNALTPLDRLLAPRHLVGLDIDEDLLAVAARRLHTEGTRATLIPGDVRNLPFPDASFDVVIDFGTCYHVARQCDALREIARVLARGGRFITETKINQFVSHPIRSRGRHLPWDAVPGLVPSRWAFFWESRRR